MVQNLLEIHHARLHNCKLLKRRRPKVHSVDAILGKRSYLFAIPVYKGIPKSIYSWGQARVNEDALFRTKM